MDQPPAHTAVFLGLDVNLAKQTGVRGGTKFDGKPGAAAIRRTLGFSVVDLDASEVWKVRTDGALF
jgi:hypothetical protein